MSGKLKLGQFIDPKGSAIELAGFLSLVAYGGAPTNSVAGYAKGAIWVDTTNGLVYYNSGSTTSTTWTQMSYAGGAANAVSGVGSGYKIARGTTALDGSNPTPVTTGLNTVVSANVTLEGSSAPGVGTSVLTQATTNWATGALSVYAWKVTSNADPTLIASTGTETFDWIAIGT